MAVEKVLPGSDVRFEEAFDFAFVTDEDSVDFLNKHGRVMFIVRGLPGTGKSTLSSLLLAKYPNATKCSADDYFSEPFVPKTRDKESLPMSHAYCNNKVVEACRGNQHPIIVQNSHIRKWEMQPYIDLAAEYCYTVIMAVTTKKVAVKSKVLEKTNTKGLSRIYFQTRIKQWEEVVPHYTGWFLNPSDTTFILKQAEISLSSVEEEQQFISIFSGDPVDYFKWENQLFCIARYCHEPWNLGNDLGKMYYLSDEVQFSYGKCYKLTILGFAISESFAVALVQLSDDSIKLVEKGKEGSLSADSLADSFSNLGVHERKNECKLLCEEMMSHSKETTLLVDWKDDESISIDSCSLIVLGSSKRNPPKFPFVKNAQSFCKNLFNDVSDAKGNINVKNFTKLESGLSFCKLQCDNWFLLSYKKITFDTVFSGLYV